MRKRNCATIICIFLFFTSTLSAQWVSQFDTGKDLWAIQAFANGTGYCVGQNGFVSKLTDFGAKWTDVQTPSQPLYYFGLCFLTENIGWIVGTTSTIYITETGGDSWIEPENPIPFNYAVLRTCDRFMNETVDLAWVGGDNSVLYRTADKGKVWQNANTGITGTVRDIKFVDNRMGYCATTRGIFKTASAGSTWEKESDGALIALSFTPHGSGWAAGWFGTILYSDSLLGDWKKIALPAEYSIKHIWGVSAISDQNVYVIGDGGLVFHSSDTGATWQPIRLREEGETRNLRAIFALDEDHIWIIGEKGVNYYSLGEVKFINPLSSQDTLFAGDTLKIEFDTPFNSRININFQRREGATWETVVQNYAMASGPVSWKVPDINSPQARLRISSAVPSKELSDEMTFKILR
jgi:photosystem II stability/assembly factor-like uncharacterized protein